MADDSTTTTTDVTQDAPTESEQGAPAAEPSTTETPSAEHMIPKSRFDEVNKELKALRKQSEAAQKAQEAAEAAAAAEKGEYKKLYDTEKAKVVDYEAKVKALEVSHRRARIASEVGLPAGLVERLQGEEEDEIKADAEKLLALIPKESPATSTDSGAGARQAPQPTEGPDEESVREFAAVYGLNFETAKQVILKQQ